MRWWWARNVAPCYGQEHSWRSFRKFRRDVTFIIVFNKHIIYSCNIIIVIAAIPRDHRRLLPRQFEERSLGMKKKNDGTNNMFKMGWREWDDAKFTRVFLAWTAACRGRRSWRVIEREQRRKWKWRKEKKKSEIIYIYYCIESCALRLRFKLVRL